MGRRAVGEPAAAEAALLCAFELLAQTEGADPEALAALLRLLAAVAGDRGSDSDPAPYAAAAARLAAAPAAAGVDRRDRSSSTIGQPCRETGF